MGPRGTEEVHPAVTRIRGQEMVLPIGAGLSPLPGPARFCLSPGPITCPMGYGRPPLRGWMYTSVLILTPMSCPERFLTALDIYISFDIY